LFSHDILLIPADCLPESDIRENTVIRQFTELSLPKKKNHSPLSQKGAGKILQTVTLRLFCLINPE